MNGLESDPARIEALLELASGDPELVVVDARALRLVMGPLAELLILRPVGGGPQARRSRREYDPDEDGYIWDSDDLC